ncbi:MAG: beta-ketoacyl synthase N-terminal-like domain-containing protein, partial [Bacteroidota bacterium]
MELKRAVITGLGSLTPIGNNTEEYWNNLIKGVSGSDLVTRFNPEKYKTKFGCEVKNFNPEDFIPKKEVRKLDLYAQFALVAAEEAMKDSNLDLDRINHDRAGVIWGSGIGGIETFLKEVQGYATGDGTPRFNPFFIPKMISDIAGGHISIKYNFRGPNFTTVSACASSTNALIDALAYIRLGKADIFISGGSEASINEPGMAGFNAMHAISTRNDEYKT